jgi:mono/diheme cytochrome c family protein
MSTRAKAIIGELVGFAVLGVIAVMAAIEFQLHRSFPLVTVEVSGPALQEKIARGRYVADAADCAACHTSPSGQPFAGGYSLQTPFGPILSSNITSDPTNGLGGWTEAQFDKAMRHGIGRNGYLYPAMPYNDYARMADADIDDLWAYMKTVPAVEHAVVENTLPFPFNQRWILIGWNTLFFNDRVFQLDPSKSDLVNRGAYLVDGAGHCAACHTAKGLLGGDVSAYLQGGRLAGWHAPDLTPNIRLGLGSWTTDDIVLYLKTGTNAHAVASGPMTEAVENSTQYLTDGDLHAIAAYLQQLPASPEPKGSMPPSAAAMATGKAVFETQCTTCHVSSGKGVPNMVPALAGSPVVNATDPSSLEHVILLGSVGPMTAGNPTSAGMPRFDWRLPDNDVAAVITFVRNSWGNAAPPVDTAKAMKARDVLHAKNWLGR